MSATPIPCVTYALRAAACRARCSFHLDFRGEPGKTGGAFLDALAEGRKLTNSKRDFRLGDLKTLPRFQGEGEVRSSTKSSALDVSGPGLFDQLGHAVGHRD